MPNYHLKDLLQVMSDLRSPEHGCPWDLKQNYQTILPHTLEEVYEVADAIERGDLSELRLELGDLLFQVIFYSQLAKEEQAFDFNDVVSSITEKLLRRHPHVFPQGTLESAGSRNIEIDEHQIKENWQRIKEEERQLKNPETKDANLTDTVPLALPALMRAFKVQQVVGREGFDWPNIEGVWDKLAEEVAELKEAIESRKSEDIVDEVGDLLFTCVNLARHLMVNPEMALRSANLKFEKRFARVEKSVASQNKRMKSLNPQQLELEWQLAKTQDVE